MVGRADQQRVAGHGHRRSEELPSDNIAADELGLLAPARAAAQVDIGGASACAAGGAGGSSPDRQRVPRKAEPQAKVQTSYAVAGNDLGLLAPGCPRARKDIGRAHISSHAFVFVVAADHQRIAVKGHAAATGRIVLGIAGQQAGLLRPCRAAAHKDEGGAVAEGHAIAGLGCPNDDGVAGNRDAAAKAIAAGWRVGL